MNELLMENLHKVHIGVVNFLCRYKRLIYNELYKILHINSHIHRASINPYFATFYERACEVVKREYAHKIMQMNNLMFTGAV
jgi:hypothetical protein